MRIGKPLSWKTSYDWNYFQIIWIWKILQTAASGHLAFATEMTVASRGSSDEHAQGGKARLTFPNVSPGVLNSGVPVNVGEQPKAEAVLIVGRIGETVNQHTCGGRVEGFAHTVVELIVHNRAPVLWFLISNSLNVCGKERKGSIAHESRLEHPQPETTL